MEKIEASKRQSMALSTVFPPEIIEDILSRLPVKTLKKFECVSKPWNELITCSQFINLHLSRSKENSLNFHIIMAELGNYDKQPSLVDFNGAELPQISLCNAKLWGSCNGLLLAMLPGLKDYIFLWNPSTNEYKKLPPHINPQNRNLRYGFGHNARTMDYEVVLIQFEDRNRHVVQVYSLRNNSWRKLEDISYSLESTVGELVNGKLYWEGSSCIIAYDMATEKFQELPLPKFVRRKWQTLSTKIRAFGDKYLYYFEHYDQGFGRSPRASVEAWAMKDDGCGISWTKMIDVKCSSLFVLFSTKEGLALMLRDSNEFVCYDPRKGTWMNRVIKEELVRHYGLCCAFVPSLVALGDGSEKMGKTIPSSENVLSDLSKLRAVTLELIN